MSEDNRMTATSLFEYVLASETVWTSCHTTRNDDDHDDDDYKANVNANCALYQKKKRKLPSLTFLFSHISKTIIKRRKRLNNTTIDSQKKAHTNKNIDLLLAIVVCVLLMNQIRSSIL
jgi:hypothetical protein